MNKYDIKFYESIRFFTNFYIEKMYNPIVINKEVLPKEKFILAGNHKSALDVLLLAYALGTDLHPRFIAKEELFDTNFKNWFMSKMGAISINREEPSMATLKEVIKMVKNENEIIAIFPEGTRNNGELLEFKKGATIIASLSKAPIYPFGISGEYKIRKSPIIEFGEGIDINKIPKNNREDYLRDKVKMLIRK